MVFYTGLIKNISCVSYKCFFLMAVFSLICVNDNPSIYNLRIKDSFFVKFIGL